MPSYKTTNPYIKSRFEKTLLKCNQCKLPLLKRKGGKFWIVKRQQGEIRKIEIEIPSKEIKIRCDCGWGIIFGSVDEVIRVQEILTARKETI